MLQLLCLLCLLPVASPEAFSSTAQLKLLVSAERDMTGILQEYLGQEVRRLETIQKLGAEYVAEQMWIFHKTKRIIDIIAALPATEPGDLAYAGHPINAYNLVKRWYHLSTTATNLNSFPPFSYFLYQRGLQMPAEADFIGAGAAVLRLQRTYNLKTKDLAEGNVFVFYSSEPLSHDDMYIIGDTAMKNNDYGLAAQWFDKSTESTDPYFSKAVVYLQLARAHTAIGDYDSAAKAAKAATLSKNAAPSNSPTRAEAWSLVNHLEFLRRGDYHPLHNMTTWQRNISATGLNYEALCRGDRLYRPAKILKTLTCRYKPGDLPYVVYKEETLSWDPRISMFYDVISDGEADMIQQLATPLLYRAHVGGDPSVTHTSTVRVSKIAWLWDTDTEYDIKKLSNRVEDITGLETEYRLLQSSSEPFQVVNYGIGGQYEPHVDFYKDDVLANIPQEYIRNTGDRMATFLFYLSHIEHGGATVFPKVGVRVPPVKNAAAFWYNASPSGQFDHNTEHAGCPVLLGEKWVANKWIREFGQEFRRPCPVDQFAVWDV